MQIPNAGQHTAIIRFLATYAMAPTAHVIVQFVKDGGEVVADAIDVELDGVLQNYVSNNDVRIHGRTWDRKSLRLIAVFRLTWTWVAKNPSPIRWSTLISRRNRIRTSASLESIRVCCYWSPATIYRAWVSCDVILCFCHQSSFIHLFYMNALLIISRTTYWMNSERMITAKVPNIYLISEILSTDVHCSGILDRLLLKKHSTWVVLCLNKKNK